MPLQTVERSKTQAEEMRQQRNQEARQLIGNSVDKAKAIFAQNTAAGQIQSKGVKMAPVKPVRNSIARSTNNHQQQSPEPEQEPEPEADQLSEPKPETETNTQSEQLEASTIDVSKNNLQETETTVAEQSIHNLENNESDPYSTIKRSPYTKVSTNCQNEPSANNKQAKNVQTETVTQTNTVEKQPAGDPGNAHNTLHANYIE